MKNIEEVKTMGRFTKQLFLLGLFIFILLPAALFSTELPGMPNGWSEGYVYANGIRIHYYQATPAPGKPVIVMVHGVTDIGLCWTTLSLQLQDAYNIFMLDTRAHGLSDPFTEADDSMTLVKDVVAFVKVMNIDKPILMGHSLGAATVMCLGAEYPDLAQSIIMLDPMLGSFPSRPRSKPNNVEKKEAPEPPQPKKEDPKNLSVNMFGAPETLVAQNNYDFSALIEKCHHDSPKWDTLDCIYWALSKKQYHGAYSGTDWQVMSGPMTAGNSLARITVPALILKADAPPEKRKANEEAAKVMQNGKLVHIDGAAHNLHHDQLKQTVKEIKEFLSNL